MYVHQTQVVGQISDITSMQPTGTGHAVSEDLPRSISTTRNFKRFVHLEWSGSNSRDYLIQKTKDGRQDYLGSSVNLVITTTYNGLIDHPTTWCNEFWGMKSDWSEDTRVLTNVR